MRRFALFSTSVLLLGGLSWLHVSAAASGEPPRLDDVGAFLIRIFDVAFALGGLLFLGLAVAIGFQWLTSQGNDDTIQEARQRLTYLVIGFFLFFLSVTIVTTVFEVLDVRNCNDQRVVPGLNLIYEGSCEGDALYAFSYSVAVSGGVTQFGGVPSCDPLATDSRITAAQVDYVQTCRDNKQVLSYTQLRNSISGSDFYQVLNFYTDINKCREVAVKCKDALRAGAAGPLVDCPYFSPATVDTFVCNP